MKREQLLIEADELAANLANPNLQLFDATFVRRPGTTDTGETLYQQGHIPGAVFLDHASISDTSSELNFTLPEEQALADKLGKIGIGNNAEVVIYAAKDPMWATRVWWVLRYAGHENVRVLNGGLSAWTGELETAANLLEPVTFTINTNPGMFASRAEVEAAMSDSAVCTLNALPHSLYTGESDIAYAKAGHITGSLSQPYDAMMDGPSIKSDEALKAAFGGYNTSERLITYCGGGVAATLNASCALLAGFTNVGVYDGSMSEWLQQGLPTTRGAEPG